jgi:tRNA-modifying protein YgfZ
MSNHDLNLHVRNPFGLIMLSSSSAAAPASPAPIPANPSHEFLAVMVNGPDAAAFLQGQFTHDVAALAPGSAQLSGWASPKGRLLFTFVVWRLNDAFALIVARELAAALQKRLSMFVLRSKVTLSAMPADAALVSFADARMAFRHWGQSDVIPYRSLAIQLAAGEATALLLPGDRGIVMATHGGQSEIARGLATGGIDLSPNQFALAGIKAGIPEVTVATQDLFVPQMVNFELIDGLSFKKGCYPGQEIVARTQYRGKIKRRMAMVQSTEALLAGQPVYTPALGDQVAGHIVLGATDREGWCGLVSGPIDAIHALALTVGGQPLRVLPLPYAVPEMAAITASAPSARNA